MFLARIPERLRLSALAVLLASTVLPVRAETRKPPTDAHAPPAAKAAGFTSSIEPTPAWVVPAVERADVRVDRAPLHYRVIDEQRRVDDKGVSAYSHVVRVVDEAAGLGPASQVEVVFDPAYQTLVWHHFDIVRNGKRINKLDRKRIQLLQRETQLERRIVDGRVTASVVLDDVRVGDQIDFAYSIRGDNPVFNGRFVERDWMISQRGPVALYQVRLLAPEGRKINLRVGASDIVQSPPRVERGMREIVLRRESVPQLQVETQAPYSAVQKHTIEFSEYSDWADVARWGQGLFAQTDEASAALDRQAAQIKSQSAEPEQQLLAALRFVQTEVRYFGTEVGLNSHRPAPPDKVLEQRFGDCKDKVGLLVALLRRLDIDAVPVLVSTYQRGRVDSMLPSPLDFDHVIARVTLAGKTYWLDATRAHQTGTLANRQAVGFDKGLPLAAGVDALAMLPSALGTQRMLVQDSFRIHKFDQNVMLDSRITYRGDLAEMVREALATRSMAEVETQWTAPYARIYPKLKSAGPLRVEDSDTDDAVTLVQSFSIGDYWRFPEERSLVGDIVHWSIAEALRLPNEPNRREPYALAFAGVYRHETRFDFDEDTFTAPNAEHFDEQGALFELHGGYETTARRTTYWTEARQLTDQVSPADWSAYTAQFTKAVPRLSLTLSVSALPPSALEALRRQLVATDEAVKSRKLKLKTRVQYEATVKSQLLSAKLVAGRLSPTLQAQALTARGIQYDHLARYDEAMKDFDRAMELAPDSIEAQNAAAVNAMQRRDYDRAVALASAVLGKSASNNEARNTRVLAHYFAGDLAAAQSDLDELLKDRSQLRRGYPLLWQSLVARQGGKPVDAALSGIAEDALPTDWPRPLVDWALGKASADELIERVKREENPAEHLCEAYYYIGESFMAAGDKGRAADYFQKSVDQGVTEFLEDGAARNRLLALRSR